jgi:hypothetical protein
MCLLLCFYCVHDLNPDPSTPAIGKCTYVDLLPEP